MRGLPGSQNPVYDAAYRPRVTGGHGIQGTAKYTVVREREGYGRRSKAAQVSCYSGRHDPPLAFRFFCAKIDTRGWAKYLIGPPRGYMSERCVARSGGGDGTGQK